MAKGGQPFRIPLARKNGTEDFKSACTLDLRYDIGQLDIHQFQGTLHLVHISGRGFYQVQTLTNEEAEFLKETLWNKAFA